jgi:hypothetical protein
VIVHERREVGLGRGADAKRGRVQQSLQKP